jgi:5,6-dimethylbenzimidazole synthase
MRHLVDEVEFNLGGRQVVLRKRVASDPRPSIIEMAMSAHLAAAALGYAVWWITAIGQDEMQRNIRPLLGIPEELDVVDIMCFGPPLKPSYKRWKKPLDQIVSWDRFNHQNLMTVEQIEDWVKTRRHKVMYRDETNVD